ncbi:MAG: DNRLRE domain-containing protein [Verrucomicrobiae bacterium]|nr:DNRLRE domain-containing protein [Verrucomicrobiae bacterium]
MIHKKQILILICAAAFAFGKDSPTASAATTNLLPIADTYIRDSAPTANFGASTPLLAGIALAGSPVQRCLFKFSLADLPSDATITGVSLRLVATAGPREASNFDLHRVLRDWTENDATWNVRLPATPWGAPGAQAGADFVTTSSVTAQLQPVLESPTINDFSSPGMVADVQLWLEDPNTNFGWILLATGGQAGSGRQLASRENVSLGPVLTIDYTVSEPLPPALPPTLFDTALVGDQIRFSFNAQSNRTYTVEFRESLTTGEWNTVTNLPTQTADTVVHLTNAISAAAGYFRARTP